MTTNLKNKTVRVIDNGLFVSFARTLARDFGKVQYCNPNWRYYAPRSRDLAIGTGFDELEHIRFPLHDADSVDLWVFLDLYHHDLQVFLEDHGARVWGPRNGEEMELHRWEFKEFLKKVGLPVQHCEHIIGIERLKTYLRGKEGKYVKTSFVRGDFETFRHDSFELTEPRLDELAHQLGALKNDYEFIVEDEIPEAVEVGYDGFTVDGKFPSHAMMGYEVKDVGMIAVTKPYEELADPVKLVNSKLSPAFRDYKFRGFFCTEIRYDKQRKPYFIDPCCRLGSPSNELLQELFKDWGSVVWHGADGEIHPTKPSAKFGCLAVIQSEWATDNWQPLFFPKEIDQFVKLRFHCKVDGVDYVVPQNVGCPQPGCVVGVGNTLIEAVKMCKENAAQIKGPGVSVSLESIDKALETVKEGEKRGIKFADRLPTREELSKA